MALTDIVNFAGEPLNYDMARGNDGVLVDVQGAGSASAEVPVVVNNGGGGNIFIMSE